MDVFTDRLTLGIPFAVIVDSDGLSAEDPVTGSLNASMAQWLLGTGRISAPYVARQGTALGRSGRVSVSCDQDGGVWVGGSTVIGITGTLEW